MRGFLSLLLSGSSELGERSFRADWSELKPRFMQFDELSQIPVLLNWGLSSPLRPPGAADQQRQDMLGCGETGRNLYLPWLGSDP